MASQHTTEEAAGRMAADLLHRVRMVAGSAVEKGLTETAWLEGCRSAFEWAEDDYDLGQDTGHRESAWEDHRQ